MHKQILTPSPVRPEAAQPAADSPTPALCPHVKLCFQGAPGAMLRPISAVSPLMCPAEAVAVGTRAVSPGEASSRLPRCPADGTGETRFTGAGGSLGRALQGEGKG